MAEHTVMFTDMGPHEVGKEQVGIKFDVKDESGQMGELTISKGGVRWAARNARSPKLMTWEEFAKRMAEK